MLTDKSRIQEERQDLHLDSSHYALFPPHSHSTLLQMILGGVRAYMK